MIVLSDAENHTIVFVSALSRISPRVRVRVNVSTVYRIATGGYSWIWSG